MLQVLEYHHLPSEIKTLIIEYCVNYAISMGTDDYSTEPMIAGKGVLKGECLSSLLFNMIVNTLTKSIGNEKICCMGCGKTLLHVTGFNLLIFGYQYID